MWSRCSDINASAALKTTHDALGCEQNPCLVELDCYYTRTIGMGEPIWITTAGKPLTTTILAELRLHHFILFLVVAVCSKVVYNVFLHPLRRIPGPLAARATEFWRTRRYALGKWHDDILELHEKFGPVVRIAPNEVSFVDKAALVQVYGHSSGTKKVRMCAAD